jgi:branched-subunit amino acid transport protein
MTNAFLIVVTLASLVTLALKCAFIEGQQYFKLPQWFTDSLEFVPPAVLCALVIPGIFQGNIDPKPIAACVAAITFFTTKKTIPTLIAGMASLYVVYWLQI